MGNQLAIITLRWGSKHMPAIDPAPRTPGRRNVEFRVRPPWVQIPAYAVHQTWDFRQNFFGRLLMWAAPMNQVSSMPALTESPSVLALGLAT